MIITNRRKNIEVMSENEDPFVAREWNRDDYKHDVSPTHHGNYSVVFGARNRTEVEKSTMKTLDCSPALFIKKNYPELVQKAKCGSTEALKKMHELFALFEDESTKTICFAM